MLTQTLAILRDTYRELNAKKMFWVVLVISALVVLVFAGIGVDAAADNRVTLFGTDTPFNAGDDRAEFYKKFFNDWGVTLWLSIIATILALISTAAVFPDFVSGGSVDLYLCRPMSRLRLFLTKYAAALVFVALQVFVFALSCFLVIGLRGGAWEPGIFLSVPLVVCFFSYLFAISVLVGVFTRSTLTALLLTLLAWFGIFLVDQGEVALLLFKTAAQRESIGSDTQLRVVEGQIAYIEKQPAEVQQQRAEQLKHLRTQRDDLVRQRERAKPDKLAQWHRIVMSAKLVLPKTRETTEVLSRALLTPPKVTEEEARGSPFKAEDIQRVQDEMRVRPLRWVIGTSLAFEVVVLALAAWIFCRRDY